MASVDLDKIRLGDIGTEKTIRADGVASVTSTGILTSSPIFHGFCLAPHCPSSSQELAEEQNAGLLELPKQVRRGILVREMSENR